jgi:6-pyruvoyltetrahydropterin/6-carboxytetrahydropterin synthase|tara:strand:+ start:375 stop:1052 length:678 start_codon:yes stop_codon:yes gene_type:complete
MSAFKSTKIIPMGSTAFRQWRAESHCQFIHGYRLQTKIWFGLSEGATLDDKNWVFDFGGCKEIKKLLEDQFDHTFCAAADDPELEVFKMLDSKGLIQLRIMDGVGIEKTAEWVYTAVSNYVKESTKGRVKIDKVEVWEHEGNSAIYDTRLDTLNNRADKYVDQRVISKEKAHEMAIEENKEILNNLKKEKPIDPELDTGRKSSLGSDIPVSKGMSNPFQGTSWGN